MKKLRLLFVGMLLSCIVQAQLYQPNWPSLDSRPVPAWFTNAKFGIFIHWGLYSVPAWATNSYADGFGSNYAEWYWQRLHTPSLKIHKEFKAFHEKNYGTDFKYQDFVHQFKAEMFNPEQWVKIFKQSGAKYVVLTSKHHDGFALWPSKESWNWNSVDVGPHRDIAGELSKAVKASGLHMGFYYSLYEWYNPLYKSSINTYVEQRMLPQLKELVNTYKPDIIWSDGDWDHTDTIWKSREFLSWLYNESPVKESVVVNDRWGGGTHGGFNSTEYGKGNASLVKAWEETRGIGESFGFNRNENLAEYAGSEQLIHTLINVVSRGGNLLLNVGPTADGRIPVIMQQRLKDIGDWLQVNGDAIYDTQPWIKSDTTVSDIYYTRKGKDLYVHVTKWKNQIEIKGLPVKGKVSLLGYEGRIATQYKKGVFSILPSGITPGNNPGLYAWVYKIENVLNDL